MLKKALWNTVLSAVVTKKPSPEVAANDGLRGVLIRKTLKNRDTQSCLYNWMKV